MPSNTFDGNLGRVRSKPTTREERWSVPGAVFGMGAVLVLAAK